MSRSIDVEVHVENAAAVGAFAGLGAAVAGAGIQLATAAIDAGINAIGDSIELASAKAEAASKVNVLFAESADAIHAASQTAATTVGLSSGAYLTAAGNLGNLLKNFDLSTDAAAGMSTGMIQLAADVGSFNDADPSEVIEAMGAALRGESEPMQRFGVDTREAALQQYALSEGLIEAGGSMDKATRAQAIYGLMLDQTSAAQGDFERTSSGLANQQRINAARMEEAWTKVGEKLKPIAEFLLPMLADAVVGVVEVIDDVITAIGEWVDDNQDLIDTLSDIAGQLLGAVQTAFGWLLDIVGELGYRVGGLIGLFIDLAGAIIDTGAAILAVMRGDFDAAGEHAQLALTRIQGFQANVQRAIGDTARRAADEAELSARATTEAHQEMIEDVATTSGLWWAQMGRDVPAAAERLAGDVGEKTASELERLTPRVGRAADDMAGVIPEELGDARDDAVDIAAKTPVQLADAMRSRRASWQDALRTLGDDIKNAMTRAQEIGELEAALAGKRLAKGLNSADPVVRAQAEATRDLILDRLAELKSGATGAANGFVGNFTAAIRAGRDDVARAINYTFGKQMAGQSPPAEGPLHYVGDWADRVFGYYIERAQRALTRGFGGIGDALVPRSLAASVSSGPVYSGAGAGVTVNVYTGVGDPVAIGREVNDVLEAFYRASGRGE